MPELNFDSLNFWSQIAFAMVGLEVAPILGGEIHDPGNVIPRAAWISGIGCAGFYMAGTAAMLALLAPEKISPLTGLGAGGPSGRRALSAQAGFRLVSRCSSPSACRPTDGVRGRKHTTAVRARDWIIIFRRLSPSCIRAGTRRTFPS